MRMGDVESHTKNISLVLSVSFFEETCITLHTPKLTNHFCCANLRKITTSFLALFGDFLHQQRSGFGPLEAEEWWPVGVQAQCITKIGLCSDFWVCNP